MFSSLRFAPMELPGVVYMRISGALEGVKGKVFKMILLPVRKISQKHCMTLAVAPGCRTSRHKPRGLLPGRNADLIYKRQPT